MWLPRSALSGICLLYCLCCNGLLAQGQGFDHLTGVLPPLSPTSPRVEHRSHASHFWRNASAPVPAPGPSAGAPSSEMLPSKAVTGVAHVGAPAAEGPVATSHLQGPNGTFSQLHRSHASVPVSAPAPTSVTAAAPADNSTEMKATQTFTPAVPAALVDPDGSLILTGPSSSSTGLGTTGLSTTGASADHLLWWVIAIIALVGIVCSVGWMYSRNRSRRYMDLKEADSRMTEMAAQQQRHDARV